MNKMNNKKKLLIGLPVLMFAMHESGRVDAQAPCEVQEPPPVCQDARRITINVESGVIAPGNVCIDAGESLLVNVSPSGRSARVESKSGVDWLSGSGESFTLQVPADATGEYDYNVYFPDGTCIDPRITVGR